MQNHYKTLGIKSSATPEEVKKAYFEMAKKYHPDSSDASELSKFYEVAEAYEVLSETVSRKAYDDSHSDTASSIQPVSSTTRQEFRDRYRDDELREFHRNRFKKAAYRVVGFTLLIGLVGYVIAPILGGISYWGGASGLLVGFSFSINKNFSVSSFFKSDKIQKGFRMLTWLMLLVGFAYFVFLVLYSYK